MIAKRNHAWTRRRSSALAIIAMLMTSISGGLVPGMHNAMAQNYADKNPATQDDGQTLFAKCGACHALTPGRNGRGPTLYHLFGRRAGSVPGYGYSLAMKRSKVFWRENTLTQFILDPQRVVPGTTMQFTVSATPQQMRALIDYLRTATR